MVTTVSFNLQNEIIEILTDDNINYKQIVVDLAKRDPNLLYLIDRGDRKREFDLSILEKAKKNRVNAVKTIREEYGFSLKQTVDYLRDIEKDYDETK